MARPPSEWPIPIYDLELRERLIACYTLPSAAILHHAPAPLTPTVLGGKALCAVTLASGRVLKRAGVGIDLASEFHLLEVQTPVAWKRPCGPTERGLFTLHAASDHSGLNRLLSRCAADAHPLPDAAATRGKVQLSDGYRWWEGALPLRAFADTPWPASSVIDSAERAETLLAHPAYRFFTEAEGPGVRAVPVRDYARDTRSITATVPPVEWLADQLQLEADNLALDHILLQKRVTQTVFFPSERLNALRRSVAQLTPRDPFALPARA